VHFATARLLYRPTRLGMTRYKSAPKGTVYVEVKLQDNVDDRFALDENQSSSLLLPVVCPPTGPYWRNHMSAWVLVAVLYLV
jgi:hypothetical protein